MGRYRLAGEAKAEALRAHPLHELVGNEIGVDVLRGRFRSRNKSMKVLRNLVVGC
jgi:hypothetical protein